MVLSIAVESRVMKRRDSSREVNFAADLNGGSDLIYIPDGDKSVARLWRQHPLLFRLAVFWAPFDSSVANRPRK